MEDQENEYQESRRSTSLFNKHAKEVLFGDKSFTLLPQPTHEQSNMLNQDSSLLESFAAQESPKKLHMQRFSIEDPSLSQDSMLDFRSQAELALYFEVSDFLVHHI